MKILYYTAGLVSGQDEENSVLWMINFEGKIDPSCLLRIFSNKVKFFGHTINYYWPSLSGQDGRILAEVFFYDFVDSATEKKLANIQ